jgi:fumarate reductase flavoprotein subunit
MSARITRVAGPLDAEITIPVVVIGGGACGLVAALAAADAGQSVLVLERDASPAGSTAMSSGFIPAAGTRWQRAAGVHDNPQRMQQDIETKNHYESDSDVVAAICRSSAATLEWLADRHGLPFELVEGFLYPGHTALRMHCTPKRSGEELMACLLQACSRAGIDILSNARVDSLMIDHADRVRGVQFVRPDGSTEQIGCEALILACSGFAGNPELVARYLPYMSQAVFYGHPGNRGDALAWGQALGAACADLGACQGHGSLAWPHQTLISWALMMQGGVQVNRLGQRFSNEHLGYSEQARRVLEQPDHRAWNLYDDRIHAYALSMADYRDANAAGAIVSADSPRTLAERLGLPADAVEQTLREVDGLCERRECCRWGRQFTPEQRLSGPWYAVQVTGALFHSQGGLVVDTQARVLRPDGTALPNLLAGGGAARGLSGSNDTGYLSGNGLLSAVMLGAIAGRSAAALADSTA